MFTSKERRGASMQLIEFHRDGEDKLRIALNPDIIAGVNELKDGKASLTVVILDEDIPLTESYNDVIKLLGSITQMMGADTIALMPH